MSPGDKVNILLVDDQPAKLLSYEVILSELGENLIKANSANEALEHLLRHEVAVVLIDVVMPDLDGFELAAMIREHPRFQRTAIIFVSAIQMTELDLLRGYRGGRGRLRAGAGRAGTAARQGAGIRRPVSQDPPARAAQRRAGTARRGAHRGTRAGQRRAGAARRGAHARTRGGARAGARDAEAGEPRPAHRRRRARLQQPADGDPRQSAACCANACRTIRACCAWSTARCRAPSAAPR